MYVSRVIIVVTLLREAAFKGPFAGALFIVHLMPNAWVVSKRGREYCCIGVAVA